MAGIALDSSRLRARHLASGLEALETVDSTNRRAKELARAGVPHGFCVAALEQTAGRGRRDRSWHSPSGAGLYASFILRPRLAPRDAPLLTLAAAVGLAEAARALAPIDVRLKWPNDLLAGPSHGALALRKLGGILIELAADARTIEHAVVGIGLNLLDVARPTGLGPTATSIEALSGQRLSPGEALAELASALEVELDRLDPPGGAREIVSRWTERAAGLGERVTLESEGLALTGVLLGIAADGALELETEHGLQRIYAGDLVLPGAPRPFRGRLDPA